MEDITIVKDTDLGAAIAQGLDKRWGEKYAPEMAKLSDSFQTGITGLGKRLEEALSKPATEDKSKAPEAKLEAGALSTVTGFQVQSLPVGAVALGGFLAIFGTELIDGVLAKQTTTTKALAKAAGAVAVMKWGKGLGAAKNWVAGLMLFDALRDATPINTWANQLANKVSGVIPFGGLGDQTGRTMREANEVAGYAAAGGMYPSVNRRVG